MPSILAPLLLLATGVVAAIIASRRVQIEEGDTVISAPGVGLERPIIVPIGSFDINVTSRV
jgi:hypothetical protein